MKGGILVTSLARLQLSGISDPIMRGTNTSVTVTALDSAGRTDAGYRGTVRFTSNDPSAVLPPDYTFTATDAGRHSFNFSNGTGIRWITPANHTLTVTDVAVPSLKDTRTGITVTQAERIILQQVQDPIPVQATDQVFVRALDRFGTADPLYRGRVRFTSDDPSAVLPLAYTFTAADAGAHLFTVEWRTPGNHRLAVDEMGASPFEDEKVGITVTPLVELQIQGILEPLVRGSSDMFQVRAVDPDGRTATAYTGTVHFTSSDPAAVLPPDYTFVPGDQGVHTFQVTWTTAGEQSLTAADTGTPSLGGTVAEITITQAVRFVFAGIADPIGDGVPDAFTLRAVDQFGTVDALYRGTVHFTSTDPAATLPADYTFVAGDAGQHGFSVTWATAGERALTATDVADNAITSTRAAITVT
jgi:hypothetical protein